MGTVKPWLCSLGVSVIVINWKDKWCGTSLLCDSFPSLFVLVASKEAWVSNLWTGSTSGERGGGGGVGTLISLGFSMIGSWVRWRTCWGD